METALNGWFSSSKKILKKRGLKNMKKILFVVLVVCLVLGMVSVAYATDPVGEADPFTFTEETPENVEIPTTASVPGEEEHGASAWVYKDGQDASFKFEGSYAAFDDPDGTGTNDQGDYGPGLYGTPPDVPDHSAFSGMPCNDCHNPEGPEGHDAGLPCLDCHNPGAFAIGAPNSLKGPHDGYDTASNKCKTCHAVHRATGTYRLMRVDDPNDACSYCHIGDHKHSVRGAYYRSAAMGATANGHTMGAGKTIPDSSTKQWLDEKELSTEDSDGNIVTIGYKAREYNPERNKMFYWTSKRASYHDHGYMRLGPTYLSCISCHQPHNADDLIWKPSGEDPANELLTVNWDNGYKLLRSAPSGSARSTARMEGYAPISSSYGFTVEADALAGATTVMLKTGRGSANVLAGDLIHLADGDSAFDITVTANVSIGSGSGGTAVSVEALPEQIDAATGHGNISDENMVRVPDTTILRDTTGTGISAAGDGTDMIQNAGVVWTLWNGSDFDPLDTSHDTPFVPRLSVWCADCHNLNIGHYDSISGGGNFRSAAMHSDRTHTVPGRLECWNCHSGNMPVTDADYDEYMSTTGESPSCNACHYYNNGNDYYDAVRQEVPKSDFPHSGADTGFKLLTEDTLNTDAGVGTDGALDAFCMRCHDLIGDRM